MQSIIKVIPYFGQWPEWIELYIESCKYNPDIDWLIYTDCPLPQNQAKNVRFIQLSFDEYKEKISKRLDILFQPQNAYKLCDLKPALGFIHAQDIKDYDFYAYGDIDIIYGQLRHFLTSEMLNRYDVIGTHNRRLSGHFSLFRNTQQNREAFKKIKNWPQLFTSQTHFGLDESKFSKLFRPHKNHPRWLQTLWSISSPLQRRILFKEQYSTVASQIPWINGESEHPQRWLWQQGKLFNEKDSRQFMYLHFMNWKSSRWLPKSIRAQRAAWEKLDNLISVDWHNLANHQFQISPQGFTELDFDIGHLIQTDWFTKR